MRQYNEKPSHFSNIGQDILGAARHNNDTYETPEELRAKAAVKKQKSDLKQLKSDYENKLKTALSESTEAAVLLLKEYEFKKCVAENDLFNDFKGQDINQLRDFVVSCSDYKTKNLMIGKYNRLRNKMHKIRYIRAIELSNYFQTKTKKNFQEVNGKKVNWKTGSKTFDSTFLNNNVKAVQYGNSLTDNERIYVSENLETSIKILNKYIDFDFKKIGFSYGARGKAGSIAHYQDCNKVLAFNRNWDGALIHELGHAIDYDLNLASQKMPWSIQSRYRVKMQKYKGVLDLNYYFRPREIFARMFEAYFKKIAPDATDFMIFLNSGDGTLPNLDDETLNWFESTIASILKNKKAA